jgi:1,2-diacylglycerol 3-alpha-glucosyltransferase
MTPRVAIACSGLGHIARGIETWAATVAEGIHKSGGNVILFGGGARPQARSPYVRLPNLRRDGWTRTFLSWDKAYLWEQITFARNLRRHLRGDRFDIVHAADPNLAQQLIAHCRRHNLALIFQDGLSIGPAWSSKFKHVQALAPYYLEQGRAAGVDTSGWRIVPQFVDTRVFSRSIQSDNKTRDLTLLAVGDFSDQGAKRLDWIIGEFAKAKTPATLILAGHATADDLEKMKSRASKLGDRVRLMPNVPHSQIPEIFSAADVFIHAATREPFGIVLIEAMASGLPVLAHQFDVTKWILGDGGIILDMTKPGELAAAIERVLTDKTLRDQLSEKAIARARATFDKSVVLPMYHAWYQELAQRQARA